MESSADLEAQLVESLNSISTIKRFGIEEYANLKTETRFVHLLKNTYRSIYGSIMAQGGIQFVSTGITIAVLWLGSLLVVDQELTPGALMVFYSLVGYVISPIGSLISSNQTIQDALIAADRLFQIMAMLSLRWEIIISLVAVPVWKIIKRQWNGMKRQWLMRFRWLCCVWVSIICMTMIA